MMISQHIDKNVQKYIVENCLRLSESQRRINDETAKKGVDIINECCPVDCSQLLNVLVKATNARRCIEIGTLTGLPTLSMALAMPNDGLVVTLDTIHKNVHPLKEIWKEANVDQRIQTRQGDVMELLDKIKSESGMGKWDMILINDVNKNIKQVFERCLALVRPGGMICIHHILWNGNVLDESRQDENTKAVREFNRMLRDDRRVEISSLPIADGLTICVRGHNGSQH